MYIHVYMCLSTSFNILQNHAALNAMASFLVYRKIFDRAYLTLAISISGGPSQNNCNGDHNDNEYKNHIENNHEKASRRFQTIGNNVNHYNI
jgi:hypothetical protein